MNRSFLWATLLSLGALACGSEDEPASHGDEHGDQPDAGAVDETAEALQALETAVERYRSGGIVAAEADGYAAMGECVESSEGAMGIHYIDIDKMLAPQDPLDPPGLLFVPAEDGGLVLAGVEFFQPIVIDGQPYMGMADEPPPEDSVAPPLELFAGHPFDGPMAGHEPGMPWHYDQHIWLFAENPSGMFAPYNPALSCGQ